jgi:predicted esterase
MECRRTRPKSIGMDLALSRSPFRTGTTAPHMREVQSHSSSFATLVALAACALHLTGCTPATTPDEEAAPEGEKALASANVDAPPSSEAAPSGVQGASAASPAAPAATPPDGEPATPGEPPSTNEPPPADDPGPAPTSACNITKDGQGFFTRTSGGATYVAYVPPSYTGAEPMPALVAMHGCADTAANFATWAVAPFDTRATQKYIGISLGGESGSNKCWSMGADDAKVLAAVDDLAKCFWIHRKKVVVGGFSSGGQLAYRVGLSRADRFAGVAIECSGLYAAGIDAGTLLSGAAKKLPIAHRAHTSDTVFPIAKVEADWAKITAAGFPLATSKTAGGHDGASADWTGFLLPQMASWTSP